MGSVIGVLNEIIAFFIVSVTPHCPHIYMANFRTGSPFSILWRYDVIDVLRDNYIFSVCCNCNLPTNRHCEFEDRSTTESVFSIYGVGVVIVCLRR